MSERLPVPVPYQWSEARGFARLYHSNPHYQARLIMALCGLRAQKEYEHTFDENHESVEVIDRAILEFVDSFDDFLTAQPNDPETNLGPYEPDPQLIEQIESIRGEYGD